MAFEKYFTNNSQFKLILDWTYTQDIASNTSSVTAILKLQSMAYGQTYGWANKSSTISIADNSASSTVDVNMSPNQTKELWRRTATVYHNADGTRTFYLSASVNYTGISWGGVALGNITVGGNVTLPTIPRASTLNISSTHSVLNETDITYTIKKASTAFTHDLYWSFYNQNNTGFTWVTGQWDYIGGIKKNGTTTTTAKLPLTDRILQLMPNETNTWIYIYLDTFNGSTLIGRNWYRMDISLPSSVKPTVSINALVEMNTTIKGIMGTSDELVMSASQPQIQISPTASKYASITSYEYRDPWGHVVSHNGHSWNFERPKGALTSGSYSARVLDSRGRWSDWVSIGRKIHEWYNPSIQSFNVYRDPTQQHIVKIDAKGAISSLEGKNTADYWIDVLDGSNWVNKGRIRLDNNQFNFTRTVQLSDNYDIARGFSFRVNFTDRIASSTSTFNLSTAKVLLHYHKDIGVGIGKMRERGTLDVGGTSYFEHINSTGDASVKHLTVGESMEVRSGASFLGPIDAPNMGHQNGARAGDANTLNYWHLYPNGRTSWFVYPGTNAVNFPATYCFVDLIKQGGEFSAIIYEQSSGKIWRKSGNGTGISGWNEVAYTNDISYGGSSNGFYIRFPNGTQICWMNGLTSSGNATAPHGSVFTTNNSQWNYPASFTGNPPAVTIQVDGGVAWSWAAMGENTVNTSYCQWIGVSAVSSPYPIRASLVAIGRWK